MTRAELQRLAQEKLDAATILMAARSYSNAHYLAGYAIELALKAVISRRFQPDAIPDRRFVADVFTHDLEKLAALAELQVEIAANGKVNMTFEANWSRVVEWSEQSRYEWRSEGEARVLLNAIADPIDGVLPWLTRYW